MPRNYKRKTVVKYDATAVLEAKKLVERGISVRAAAKAKGIPNETLRRRLMQTSSKHGGKTVLTEEEEKLIVITLEKCSSLAWPVGSEEITLMVKSYLDSCGRTERRFKDNLPGKDWLLSFKKRWKDRIRLKKPEVLTKARPKNLNEETLKLFFDIYFNILNENGFFEDEDSAQCIFNADKTECSTDPNKQRMSFKKSSKDSLKEKCVTETEVEEQPSTEQGPETSRKRLQKVIIDAIASPQSEETKSAVTNKKKHRKRVQSKTGEVLTTPAEAETRMARKKAKVSMDSLLPTEDLETEELQNNSNKSDGNDGDQDQKTIIDAIAESEESKSALTNKKKQRKQVQAKAGEILTTPAVLKRLEEAEVRTPRKKAKVSVQSLPTEDSEIEELQNNNNNKSDASDGNESDQDQTACTVCSRLWKEYTRKGKWLICDICDEYVCPVCVPSDTDLEQDFYCKKCIQE